MPTGYTQPLYDGEPVTFPEFALRCARAFMPLISMKEEPLSAQVPEEIPPDPFYAQRAGERAAFLAEAEARSLEEWAGIATRGWVEALREVADGNAASTARRARYEAMAARVREWQPPTADHSELKSFMLDQLNVEIRACCTQKPPPPISAEEHRDLVLESARADAERAQEAATAEAERARYRTDWLRALRASLAAPAVSAEASNG
jgi:hypothetical protein